MLISHTHRFLFIHIPKNAGASINEALRPWADAPQSLWVNRLLSRLGINVNHLGPYRWKRFRRHTTADVVRRNLPAGVWKGLFKFAFVRNPWNRLVSQYNYILQMPAHHRHKLVQTMTFAEFVDFWTASGHASQMAFVADSAGRMIVDFLGRCENIEHDFAHVCRQLGVDAQIGHTNRSRRHDYRDYFDAVTRRLVADRLKNELDLLGYSFDPPELLGQCA